MRWDMIRSGSIVRVVQLSSSNGSLCCVIFQPCALDRVFFYTKKEPYRGLDDL